MMLKCHRKAHKAMLGACLVLETSFLRKENDLNRI